MFLDGGRNGVMKRRKQVKRTGTSKTTPVDWRIRSSSPQMNGVPKDGLCKRGGGWGGVYESRTRKGRNRNEFVVEFDWRLV